MPTIDMAFCNVALYAPLEIRLKFEYIKTWVSLLAKLKSSTARNKHCLTQVLLESPLKGR